MKSGAVSVTTNTTMQEEDFPVPAPDATARAEPVANEAADAVETAEAAAGDGGESGAARGRGRKLRTPFRR
ncbi:hypothetical protein LPZ50_12125, partial [Bordetella petrii]|nr:hypothetical protein [Bordetella petrii]